VGVSVSEQASPHHESLIYKAKKEADLRLLSLKKAYFILFSQEKIYMINM